MIFESYTLYPDYYYTGNIVVDINGKKGPNKVGRDIFSFIFDKEKKIILPSGHMFETRELKSSCSNIDNDPNGYGRHECTALVLREDAMNY